VTSNTSRAKLAPCEGEYVFRSLVTVDVVLAGSQQLSRHCIGGKSRLLRVRMSHEGQCHRERKGD
jgi:hypothetical protein